MFKYPVGSVLTFPKVDPKGPEKWRKHIFGEYIILDQVTYTNDYYGDRSWYVLVNKNKKYLELFKDALENGVFF